MRKLIRKLDALGIIYESITFGCSYFYDIPPVTVPAVRITVYYTDGENDVNGLREIERYCKRYGYHIKRYGHMWGACYEICTGADYDRLATYQAYRDKSAAVCDMEIHIRRTAGTAETSAEFNDRLRGIMAFYAAEYATAIAEGVTA